MNKYIVEVTENIQEVVYADDVQLNEGGILLFYRYEDKDGNTTTLRVAAFKVYEYFLLDEEGVIKPEEVKKENYLGISEDAAQDILNTPSFLGSEKGSTKIVLVSKADIKKQRKKEPWSIPLKDTYAANNQGLPYLRAFDHKSNSSDPVRLKAKDKIARQYDYSFDSRLSESVSPADLHFHALTWAYYDKDGNLERTEIR